MDDTYIRLAAEIRFGADAKWPGRLIVGVAGPPGSGKSTTAERVADLLWAMDSPHSIQTVSLDGFHYTRAVLDSFPNREEAFTRRGAPWTFDIDAILQFVQKIAESAKLPSVQRLEIPAPSFDHALKDPRPNDVRISPNTSIVIIDSNYLLLDEDKWRTLSSWLDFKIFVDIDPLLAKERVAKRHVAAGIEPTLEKGIERFESNDKINGDLVRSKLLHYDIAVQSVTSH